MQTDTSGRPFGNPGLGGIDDMLVDVEPQPQPLRTRAFADAPGVEEPRWDDYVIHLDPADIPGWDRRWLLGAVGLGLSLVMHLWLGATLSRWMFDEPLAYIPDPLETRFQPLTPEPLPDVEVVVKELANPDDRELDQRTALNAQSLGAEAVEKPPLEMAPTILQELDPTKTKRPIYDIPQGLKVSDRLVVPGTTGEGIIQLEAALDRVTWEIASHLQQRKVLVVWILDASGSLNEQRLAVQKRLKRIYAELGALEHAGQFSEREQPLLSGVVGFGQGIQYLTDHPTSKFDEVETAFSALKNDPTGVENVFTTVSMVMDRWKKYRVDQGRRMLLITVTDEAGDDHGWPLDVAINRCRRYGALAYVIGPAAPFGRRQGFVPYVAPEDGQTYRLPVDLGPESVVVENVVLPFWYAGPQHDNLSSGYGPYALSRLVHETGGVYFRTNMTTMAGLATIGDYDPDLMKAYEPFYGYGEPKEFLADLAKHPIRAAVFAAAQHSQTTKLWPDGTPQLSFVLNPNNFRTTFTEAQKSAAVTQYAVEAILSKIPPGVDKHYAAEPSLRWRLAFDLNYGRLLAQKVRSIEYNAVLASLKSTYTDDDVAKRVNRVELRPDRNVSQGGGIQKLAKAAELHLRRVLELAPGTPWAVLAQRELQDGFGLRVIEGYVPPPPPPPPNTNPPTPPKPRPRILPDPQPAAPPAGPKPVPTLPKL